MESKWRDSPLLPPTLVLDLDGTLIRATRKAIIKRPGLDEFLREMAPLYELVMWTIAPRQHAMDALAEFENKGSEFSHLLASDDFGNDLTKDLTKLGRDLSRIVLVDDCKDSIPDNLLENLIVAEEFYGGHDDDYLLRLSDVLRRLALARDVRVELKEMRSQGVLDSGEDSDGDDNEDDEPPNSKRAKQ